MESVICTLFEGHYHYGVAGLVNSLFENGYKGTVYAGYKGSLPVWATNLQTTIFLGDEAFEKNIADGLKIIFVPLKTNYHLTNYKPDFMLDIWEHLKHDISGIFYFDPDILLTAPWSFMTDWINCGVAVSEDVNSPLQEYHPRRCAWRNFYQPYNIILKFKNPIYVNGGFVGISIQDIEFLHLWKKVQEIMAPEIGGLQKSIFNVTTEDKNKIGGDFSPFGRTDQDALNISVEAYNSKISYGGKEVMGIVNGLAIIPHALGSTKPWRLNPIVHFLKGSKIRSIDKLFWKKYSYRPIQTFGKLKISWMNITINITASLSRLYSK